jgi:hypothetical protein
MSRWQLWTTSAIAGLALLLMAGGLALGVANRSLQADIGARQQYVQQSLQLETLYREIVRALAELGARNNDQALRDMLQRHGISYEPAAVAPPVAAPASAPAPRK